MYLKPNVVIEPLVGRWYAWSHLVSPATLALNIVGRHLAIIDSFISAPDIHESAIANPKMRGGPFMDIPKERVGEVKDLKAWTTDYQHDLIAFAQSIQKLNSLLKERAKGMSLEPLYQEIPENLKGLVELVYDLNGNPSFRFFETLLYRSDFYQPRQQSIQVWITNNDERPFVLSTPRMEEENRLHLEIDFSNPAIDLLASMKRKPGSVEELCQTLNIPPKKEHLFRSFFTAETPQQYNAYSGDKIRMRYFGHACVLLETTQTSILVDPIISYYGYPQEVDRFSDMDLPEMIDYVLITHNHQDHILFETLLPLRGRIKKLIVPSSGGGFLQDPNLKLMFENIGFDNVSEINDLETIEFEDCKITGIPFIGEHSDLNIQSKSCYHIRIHDFSVLLAADSCNVSPALYQRVQKEIGDIDILLLGMECDGAPLSWLYGPLLSNRVSREVDYSRRLAGSNYERGIELVKIFHPKEVYVYAMGMEPWLEFISSIKYTDESNPIVASNRLIAECKANGIIAERLFGEKELLYQRYANVVNND